MVLGRALGMDAVVAMKRLAAKAIGTQPFFYPAINNRCCSV